MFKQSKAFWAGFLSCAVLAAGAGVFAATERTLTATYDDIKIFIDGKRIEPKDVNGAAVEPFVVDGATYLPVRAVAEAFGKAVDWDGATNSVYIGAAAPPAPPIATASPQPAATADGFNLVGIWSEPHGMLDGREIIPGSISLTLYANGSFEYYKKGETTRGSYATTILRETAPAGLGDQREGALELRYESGEMETLTFSHNSWDGHLNISNDGYAANYTLLTSISFFKRREL